MGHRIHVCAGIALSIGVVYLVTVYREHAETQRLIDYSASVVRYIPQIPFEKGQELSVEEKQAALDLTVANNRMVLAAGLLEGDYEKENFSKAYFATSNPGLDAPKDGFDKRDRAQRALIDGASGYSKAKAEWVKNPANLVSLPVKITFMNYQFKTQAFGVKTTTSLDSSSDGGFSVSVFRDTPEPSRVPGNGSSAFERAASGQSAYQVTDRLWPVTEDKAKSVDVTVFRVYAKGYFDTSKSNTDGRTTMLHCIQIDLFADDQLTTPLGSQGCASLNITRKWF